MYEFGVFIMLLLVFIVKQKTAYEMRISDWSSDVCSSDLSHYQALDGELPSPYGAPVGCLFVSRCPMADERCTRQPPPYRRYADGAVALCHYATDPIPVPPAHDLADVPTY